jgi:ribosomal protein S18 acetylase RimI-like enzyme
VGAQGTNDRGDQRSAVPGTKESTPRPIVVERLTHGDIPEICALYKRVWEGFQGLPPELIKAWQPSPLEFTSWMEGVTYFAARRDGRMIGAIGCAVADGSCRLLNLAVDPEHRRQGVGTQLATAAVEWARHASSASVWVDALARFDAAAAMFRKLGFTESGTLHRHYFREDVRLFERLL